MALNGRWTHISLVGESLFGHSPKEVGDALEAVDGKARAARGVSAFAASAGTAGAATAATVPHCDCFWCGLLVVFWGLFG